MKNHSRLIGAFFLFGFLSYGGGFALVSSVLGAPDFLPALVARHSTVAVGAFLMLLNTVADIGKGVLFFPILECHGKRTALAYLSLMIVEVVLLDVGVVFLLMTIPLGQHAGEGWAQGVASLLTQANAMAYQVAEAALGVGGVFLCLVLRRARLVPRFLADWGLVGYAIFVAGAVAEILGIHVGVALSIPGGLFEIAIGVWLLSKSIRRDADADMTFQPAAA